MHIKLGSILLCLLCNKNIANTCAVNNLHYILYCGNDVQVRMNVTVDNDTHVFEDARVISSTLEVEI